MRMSTRKIRLALTALTVVAVLLSVFGAVPAWAQTNRYVDPTGTDAGDCSNPGSPCKTITYAIGQATAAGDTINAAAGTYNAETTWPINVNKANLTIKSVAGKATTIIDASATNAKGAIEISANGVTLDGFTIKGGTQPHSAANPQEHTVWVHANYSTIKNNTIIGALGNQACLYIGGRTGNTPPGAIWGYQVSTPTGHTIQNNSFRYAGSGEGWGIFAYELKDSLIKGNQFVGDAADVGNWNADEGAPGTGIIIHKATPFVADTVIIEDNTARYIKYTWLTFYAAYHYVDASGYGYEQPEPSTVHDVVVRDNTVYDCGKDAAHTGGTAVNFHRANKSSAYGVKCASLTVGANKVTIGPDNQFYNNDYGVYIDGPRQKPEACWACVLDADNILVKCNNIYSSASSGVWNGAKDNNGNCGQGAKTVSAEHNWWGCVAGPGNPGCDAVSANVDFTPWLSGRCEVTPPCGVPPKPVGGIIVPVNKVELLAPWMGLAALMAVAVAAVAVRRRRA